MAEAGVGSVPGCGRRCTFLAGAWAYWLPGIRECWDRRVPRPLLLSPSAALVSRLLPTLDDRKLSSQPVHGAGDAYLDVCGNGDSARPFYAINREGSFAVEATIGRDVFPTGEKLRPVGPSLLRALFVTR